MTDAERDAALDAAHTQLIAAAELSATMDRLLRGARFSLAQAAVRHDVHGDAITALQAKYDEHDSSIKDLQQTEKVLLADRKERLTP